jgi:hypothetical protein
MVRDRRILWEEGFGWPGRENRVPTTENTHVLSGFGVEANHSNGLDDLGGTPG